MNFSETKKPFSGLIHAAAWAVLLGLPFFFTGREESVTLTYYLRFVLIPLSFMLVFYVNYFLLIDRYLFTHKVKMFTLTNVVLIIAMMVTVHLLINLLPEPVGHRMPPDRTWKDMARFFTGNTFFYALVAGLSVAIKMTGGWYQTENMRKELEKSNYEAELKNLMSQLNPHFLFNTLNNIYSLIAVSPEKAQQSVHDLSKLLRYVLYENTQHFVPLTRELEFIHNYVELMRIRLPKEVDVKIDISEVGVEKVMVAPLLFISLIENAFKHGVSPSAPSFIYIRLAYENENKIVCSILNSYFPKDAQDKSGSGIGLSNLRKRLKLLYSKRFTLLTEHSGTSYVSELVLTLKPEEV